MTQTGTARDPSDDAAVTPMARSSARFRGISGGVAYLGLRGLRAMLDTRRISAVELLEGAVARIEALDPIVNAVVVRDFERARVAAIVADAALARGERGPLLGVPVTVKEAFSVAGLPTSWGMPAFRNWRPAKDAAAVARLKAAGAIILGKTNVPFALAEWQTHNAVHGTTRNPWDGARTPGGSSGGAAAALAAGFVPLEVGSDLNGSIRIPAHFCGVFGHRPSPGLVPQRGHAPPGAELAAEDSTDGLGVCGPMARSAEDLALGLDVLAGSGRDDEAARSPALPPARHTTLGDFRVLVIDEHPLVRTADAIQSALDRLAGRLAMTGAAVARASPVLPDLAEAARLHARVTAAPSLVGRGPEALSRAEVLLARQPAGDGGLLAERLRGFALDGRDRSAALAARACLRRQWRALFQAFDVVLCPPACTVAFRHDLSGEREERRIEIDGWDAPYIDQMAWSSLATPAGLPATVAPAGISEDGLPVGVQIVGPRLEDRTPLAFAALLEREFGGFMPPPGFAA